MAKSLKDFGIDLGPEVDDFVRSVGDAAKDIGDKIMDMGKKAAHRGFAPFDFRPLDFDFLRPDPEPLAGIFNIQSWHLYPPANIYNDAKGNLILEFALAGYDESSVKLGYKNDQLVLSARPLLGQAGAEKNYSRRSYRPRFIDRQKYHVPAEDYDQSGTLASFRAGLLVVTVPPASFPEERMVKIEIEK